MPDPHTLSLSALFEAFKANDSLTHARHCARLIRSGQDVMGSIRDHVLGDDWHDFAFSSLKEYFERSAGRIYLVTGPQHAGLIKLGKTAGESQDRLKSLNSAAVLLHLKLLQDFPVHDRHWVEAECHRTLGKAGVARAKEFFDATQERLAQCVQDVIRRDRQLFEAQGLQGALSV